MDNTRTSKFYKKKDLMYKQLKKIKPTSPSYHTKETKLKEYKAQLKKVIRKTKRNCHYTQFSKFANDCKNTWKLLNQVAGRKAKKKQNCLVISKSSYLNKMVKSH